MNAGSKKLRSPSWVLLPEFDCPGVLKVDLIGKTKMLLLLSSWTASEKLCPGNFKTSSELFIHIPKQSLTEASKYESLVEYVLFNLSESIIFSFVGSSTCTGHNAIR